MNITQQHSLGQCFQALNGKTFFHDLLIEIISLAVSHCFFPSSRSGEAESTRALRSPVAIRRPAALKRDLGFSWDASRVSIYYMPKITKGFNMKDL